MSTIFYKKILFFCLLYVTLFIRKAPTPKWMLPEGYIPLIERRPIRVLTERALFFRFLSLLSRKVSDVTIKLPNDTASPAIPININMISAAVIYITPLPMYSGFPVFKRWEDAALSWVLFHSKNNSIVLQKIQAANRNFCYAVYSDKNRLILLSVGHM